MLTAPHTLCWGLLAAGEDITDPGWQKNGYTIIDALCSLQRADVVRLPVGKQRRR